MNQLTRRSFLGMLAGAMASVFLTATLGHPQWSVVLGVVVGAAYAITLRPTRGAYVEASWRLERWVFRAGACSA